MKDDIDTKVMNNLANDLLKARNILKKYTEKEIEIQMAKKIILSNILAIRRNIYAVEKNHGKN